MAGFKPILLLSFFLISVCTTGYNQNNPDSLEKLLTKKSGTEHIDLLNKLSIEYYYSNPKKSEEYSYLAMWEAMKANYHYGLASAYINVGYSNLYQNNLDSAIYYLNTSLEYCKKHKLTEPLGNALLALGTTYKKLDQFSEALTKYKDALEAYDLTKDLSGKATALNNIGEVMRQTGNYQEAISNYVKALKLNQESGNQRNEVSNLLNIALSYIDQRDEKEAIKYLDEVEKLPVVFQDSVLLMRYYNRRGFVYEALKEYDKAISYHDKCVTISRKRGQSHAKELHNLANAYRQKGDIQTALYLADSALAMKKELGWQVSSVFTMNLLSDIHHALGDDAKAIDLSHKALSIAKEKKIKDRERKSLGDLAESYAAINDYQSAWEYQRKYDHLEDSLFDIQKSQQQASLLALYETEKKQQTIELQEANLALANSTNSRLWMGVAAAIIIGILLLAAILQKSKTNKILSQQKAEIELRDQEKAVLLKEIHHRVKNNLQIISSILNIQSRKLDDGSAKTAVKEGQSRIKSMSLIHEKLYGNNELSIVNMKEYIEELSAFLFKSYKTGSNIISKIEADELKLDIDRAIPLGLILNELISNSLKYAFDEKQPGMLTVKLSKLEDKIELEVSDSGKGLPENFENIQSMGMRLVNSLTEQIQGVLNVKSGHGASISISFNQVALFHD